MPSLTTRLAPIAFCALLALASASASAGLIGSTVHAKFYGSTCSRSMTTRARS